MTVAVGPAALAPLPGETVLELGHAHPSAHGALRLALTLDGDRIATADPRVGHVHRGAEKLFEARDYRQVLALANRHDWLSAFANELPIALAVERLLGLEVPARAVWLRTLLAEVNRVTHHLAFLVALPAELATDVPALRHEREALLTVLEEVSGGRVHFMLNAVGGLRTDLPPGWAGRCRAALDRVRARLPALAALLDDPVLVARTRGVGVLDQATALDHGASGVVARASGVDLDLRRDDPYLAYGDLDVPVPVRTAGDCHARLAGLVDGVAAALDLADACLDRLPSGPVSVRLPKVVRAPEGETYAWTEGPSGISGCYLVSRGGPTPHRLALRTGSYAHVQLLSRLLPGATVADLLPVLCSLFFVMGDCDK